MNFFKSIQLVNFRNFNRYNVNLNNKCNILIGPNGSGKTNILESISLFERGRGFRKEKIQNLINILSKEKKFKIESKFITNNNEVNVIISNDQNIKKTILINGSSSKESKIFFENCFSLIFFLPEMERLFLARPSIRRNFLDRLIYGVDREYISIVSNYKKKLLERFNILKNYSNENEWLDYIEKEIVDIGLNIYKKRIEYIKDINLILKSLKNVNINYKFQLKIIDELIQNNNLSYQELFSLFLSKIKQSRSIDLLIGGCKFGPHKSDFVTINNDSQIAINQFSTGQQKTIVLLIIIAQCKFLLKNLNRNPIILFDEVCSHLDNENRSLILEIINSLDVQTIMTGTEENLFSFLSTKASYCNINNK